MKKSGRYAVIAIVPGLSARLDSRVRFGRIEAVV